MPGRRSILTRIVFITGLLLPVGVFGSTSLSQTALDVGRSPWARTAEPESVRSAMAALFKACADWPYELPVSPEADLALWRRGTPIDAILCDGAVDLDGRRFPIMVFSISMTAIFLGTFAGAFVASKTLLSLLFGSLRRATFAARGVLSGLADR